MKIPVFLLNIDDYNEILEYALNDVLDCFDIQGTNILIKPNFIASKNSDISCTNPYIIYYISKFFVNLKCRVFIGDSPAFGSAKNIAKTIGLYDLIGDMPVNIIEFHKAKYRGFYYPMAKMLQYVDLLVNISKLKSHGQMGLSLCVKNLFGLIVGFNKLLAHIKYGRDHNTFSNLLLGILNYIPKSLNIVDGIWTMEKTGPLDGDKRELNLVAISNSPIGVDTAIYNFVGASPKSIPLWNTALHHNLCGSRPEHISIIKDRELERRFHFQYPKELKDISFRPDRVFLSFIKRCYLRLFK